MKNRVLKNQKGITLIALVITVVILSILATVATYSGINSIKSARFTTFTVEMKLMQTEVNELYDKYKAGDETVLSLGEDITNNDQAKTVLSTIGIANTEFSNYRYYSINTVKSLGIDGIKENEFIINIQDRKVVSYEGFEYDGVTYYTLESLPKGLYNVEYEETIYTKDVEAFQTEDTKPYLPGKEFERVDGTDLTTGLVVTDGTNYWTWIEVPKTKVFKIAESETDYTNIEKDLETYTTTGQFEDEEPLNLSRGGYTDQWYDYYGASYDGSSAYSQVRFSSASNFNTAKTYYGVIYSDNTGTIPVESFGSASTNYYVKMDDKIDDNRGCGLSYSEYNSLKQTMLSSVYRNGGFWIGQYEAGADSYPAKEDNSRIPVIAQGKYPYNYITCANAQIKSSELNSGDYTSSLMFGIQWDLVIKHLQVRGGMSVDDLTSNSTNWGNYNTATFTIENGKYTTTPSTANSFKSYTENTSGYVENKTKLQNKSVLLTTGANASENCKMNIYDIAGNQWEWTLEKSTAASTPCTIRGDSYYSYGSSSPASYRHFNNTTGNGTNTSFRSALY